MKLYIVIPWFNEISVVDRIVPRFREALAALVASGRADAGSRLLFVDDGSDDGTRDLLKAWSDRSDDIELLMLSRNRGQQFAIVQGLKRSRESGAEVVVTMDCDGQDDPSVLGQMVDSFRAGSQVVYGVRCDRTSDGFFNRTAALLFYRIMRMLGSRALYNHAEFRLMSAEVVDAVIAGWREDMFLRAFVPTLGFKGSVVEYRRLARVAGMSHYGFWSLVRLSFRAMAEAICRR